jgi:CubicO group peptidase (beta-lactamase class C family)
MMGQPLDFTPGTRCVYSNFGYRLLGLIVERTADEPYGEGVRPHEEYVREHTLEPMAIRRMRLAPTHGRRPALGEVEGFGPDDRPVPQPCRSPTSPQATGSATWLTSRAS